jgi:hypothetical protein
VVCVADDWESSRDRLYPLKEEALDGKWTPPLVTNGGYWVLEMY